jgi:hypothetical protein
VLVVYTPAAQDAASDIDGLINTAIGQANVIYDNSYNSNPPLQAQLAHKRSIDYSESGDMETDVDRLQNKNDGYMDKVHTYRDQYIADIVILVTQSGGYCGWANAIKAPPPEAFAAVKYD